MRNKNVNDLLKESIQDGDLPHELKNEMWNNIEWKVNTMSEIKQSSHRIQHVLAWGGSVAIAIVSLTFVGEHLVFMHPGVYTSASHSQNGTSFNKTSTGLNPTQSKQTPSSSKSKAWSTTVPADLQIGALRLGDPLDNAIRAYGQPKHKTTTHGVGTPEWVYPGVIIDGDPIWKLTATSASVGSTPRGIHVGSSLVALQKAYPTLQQHSTPGGGLYLSMNHDKNMFTLGFAVQKGVVTQIVITKNMPPF
jgi:stress-induced morphogen